MNGLLPLSMLAIGGLARLLTMTFLAAGIYSGVLSEWYGALFAYLVPGLIAFIASTASLAISLTYQARRRYKSQSLGFVLTALATTSIIDSIFWIAVGFTETIKATNAM